MPAARAKRRVLILCTGNSCRSQMAEGFWRDMAGDQWEVCSAGSRPAGAVHPLAIAAMAEIGIDICGHQSRHVLEYAGEPFDLVITVCDNAARDCPAFPSASRTLHWPFDDPAEVNPEATEALAGFRRVRDEIRARIAAYLATDGEPEGD